MATTTPLHLVDTSRIPQPAITVSKLTTADLIDSLKRGWEDFKAIPSHAIVLALIYPVIGLIVARAVHGYSILPLLFPLAAGFAIVGPFAAIGLYELSRRRELGMDASAWHAAEVLKSPSFGAMIGLGVLLFGVFAVWIATAQAIYVANFGHTPAAEIPNFISSILKTEAGHRVIFVGCGVGFLFAVAALSISVVAFPMMLDRHANVADAVSASLRVTARNPVKVATWGLIVAVLLVAGSIPLFLGLAVVVPVLGHATWHLYRKAVAPS